MDLIPFDPKTLVLRDEDPQHPYRSMENFEKGKITKWGQRKLGISLIQDQIEAYSRFGLDFTVVIVGAAPGFNTAFVAENIKPTPTGGYVLYDPAGFQIPGHLVESGLVTIKRKLFMQSDLNEWRLKIEAGRNVLFLSDIRTNVELGITHAEQIKISKLLMGDMRLQENWVKVLGNAAISSRQKGTNGGLIAVLKFKLPFAGTGYDDGIEYFKGKELRKSIHGGPSTTEMRQVIWDTDLSTRLWDPLKYESQAFYHNLKLRVRNRYEKVIDIGNSPECYFKIGDECELINDWDSSAEVVVLESLWKTWPMSKGDLKDFIVSFSTKMTKYLDPKLTLGFRRKNKAMVIKADMPGFQKALENAAELDTDSVVKALFNHRNNAPIVEGVHFRKDMLRYGISSIKMLDLSFLIKFRYPFRQGQTKYPLVVIGTGIGISTTHFMTYPDVESIHCVEPNEEYIKMTENNIKNYDGVKPTIYRDYAYDIWDDYLIDVLDQAVVFIDPFWDNSDRYTGNPLDIKRRIGLYTEDSDHFIYAVEKVAVRALEDGADLAIVRAPYMYNFNRLYCHKYQVEEYSYESSSFFFVRRFPKEFLGNRSSKSKRRKQKMPRDYVGKIELSSIQKVFPVRAMSKRAYGISFYVWSTDKRIDGKILSPNLNCTSDRMVFENSLSKYSLSSRKPKLCTGKFLATTIQEWGEFNYLINNELVTQPSCTKYPSTWLSRIPKNGPIEEPRETIGRDVCGFERESEYNVGDEFANNLRLVEIAGVCDYLIYEPLPGQINGSSLVVNYSAESLLDFSVGEKLLEFLFFRYYVGAPFTTYDDVFIHNSKIYNDSFNRFGSQNTGEKDIFDDLVPDEKSIDRVRSKLQSIISEEDARARASRQKAVSRKKLEFAKRGRNPKEQRPTKRDDTGGMTDIIFKYSKMPYGTHLSISPGRLQSFLSMRVGKLETTKFDVFLEYVANVSEFPETKDLVTFIDKLSQKLDK